MGGLLSRFGNTAIANKAVTNAKLADVAQATVKGRAAGAGTGEPGDLTGTEVTAILDTFTDTLKGLVPPGGEDPDAVLHADGEWRLPSGGGGTSDGQTIDGDGSIGAPFAIIQNTRDRLDVKNTYSADVTGTNDSTTALRNAITAAAANVTSTGRKTTIYLEPGEYSIRTKDAIRALNLSGKSKLVFEGVPGRTRFIQNGDAGGGDWHLFQIQDGSNDIEFRNIIFDQDGLTNPDGAEQNHLIELGNGAHNVRFYDCDFLNTIGDGIRIRGEFGAPTSQIDIQRCNFLECGRSGIGFQRFSRAVTVLGCTFTGGTDQQLDFEPTGYQLVATGGDTTTLTRTGSTFITWGIQAGDLIYNQTDRVFSEVVSVDSQTQLTTRTMPNSWNGASFWFPRSCSEHIIVGNKFLRDGTANADNLVTLTGSTDTIFSKNIVQGCVQFEHTINLKIEGNQFYSRKTNISSPVIQSIKTAVGLQIVNNSLWSRGDVVSTIRNAISVTDQGGDFPTDVTIKENTIVLDTRGIAINVESAKTATIKDNTIVVNTPGDTASGGINVRATAGAIDFVEVVGNKIKKSDSSGMPLYGIQFSVNAFDIKSLIVGGGYIKGISNPVLFGGSGGGAYGSPPIVSPIAIGTGASPIVPTSATPWFQLAGVGGDVTASAYKPGLFWGDDSPEGVLVAPVGSIAMRRNGSNGTAVYFKNANTTFNGWVPAGGVAATGSITCVAKSNLVDETDYITIGDGLSAPKRYTFDVAGDGAVTGIAVNVSTDTTAAQVAARLKTAIEANQPAIAVTDNADGTLSLAHKLAGVIGNVTIAENVAHASFAVSGMSGGVNPAR